MPFVLFFIFFLIENGLLSGKRSFVWLGPNPAVLITDPEHVKEIFTKNYAYQKIPHPNPFANSFAKGLAFLEEDKWTKHRKIINPAFHFEKFKVIFIYFIVLLREHEALLLITSTGFCD